MKGVMWCHDPGARLRAAEGRSRKVLHELNITANTKLWLNSESNKGRRVGLRVLLANQRHIEVAPHPNSWPGKIKMMKLPDGN